MIETAQIIAFLKKLKPCPALGEGVHSWVFYAACRVVEVGLTDEQAVEEIEFLMTRGPNPVSEIEDARYEIKEIGGRR